MKIVANIARKANKLIDSIVFIFLAMLIVFSGYSLWNSYMLYRGGFVSKDLLKYKEEFSKDGENPSLYDLMKINEDLIGWTEIDKTKIDFPIVQAEDNIEYLNKDIYKKFSLPGSIFLDYRNNKEFLDPYSLLYGNHMDNHGMFGDLDLFLDKKFFDKNKRGRLYLPKKTYKIDLFAIVEVDGHDSLIFNTKSINRQEDL